MTESEKGVKARATLDRELSNLQEDVLRLGSLLDTAIVHSMQALRERNEKLAQDVIANDAKLNDLRFKVEHASLSLIATQQPAARDLREIVAALNIVSDLERMGDYAAGIAKIVLRLPEERPLELPPSLTQMADLALDMLRQGLKAYSQRDEDLAYEVASHDDEIDDHYKSLFRELVAMMGRNSGMTHPGIYLMFVGHNLERTADRITNLAERVIFMNSGMMHELNPEQDEAAIN